MTVYAPSDMAEINVGEAHGGCGERHRREGDSIWGVTCDACESFLRTDSRWSTTIAGITETFDEKLARESFELRGVKDQQALMTLAVARLAGLSQSEIPPSVQRMITGIAPHIPVQGEMICPDGHGGNVPGSKFCSACGTAMRKTVPAGAITS